MGTHQLASYNHIFSIADISAIRKILGFLFFKDIVPISVSPGPHFVADLLGLDKGDVDLRLSELHFILYIPPPNGRER